MDLASLTDHYNSTVIYWKSCGAGPGSQYTNYSEAIGDIIEKVTVKNSRASFDDFFNVFKEVSM